MAERFEEEGYSELPMFDDEKRTNGVGLSAIERMFLANDNQKEVGADLSIRERIRERNSQSVFDNSATHWFDANRDFWEKVPIIGSVAAPVYAKAAEVFENVSGGDYDAARERAEARGNNPVLTEGVVDSLNEYSAEDSVRMLQESADRYRKGGADALNNDLLYSVAVCSGAYPVRTGEAINRFSDNMKEKIASIYDPETKEYQDSMENLKVVSGELTGTYYDTLMSMEQGGMRLTTEEKGIIDDLKPEGVNIKYSQYVRGRDVTAEYTDDEKRALSLHHTGSVESAIGDVSDENIRKERAMDAADSFGFASLKGWVQHRVGIPAIKRSDGEFYSDFSVEPDVKPAYDVSEAKGIAKFDAEADSFRNKDKANDLANAKAFNIESRTKDILREHVQNRQNDGDNPSVNEKTAESYMNMFKDIQAYNDEGVRALREQFMNNPAGFAKAQKGFSAVMRAQTETAFSQLKKDNDALGFMSETDLERLDKLQISGVNVKFSEYKDGMNVTLGKSNFFDKVGEHASKAFDTVKTGLGVFNNFLHEKFDKQEAKKEVEKDDIELDIGAELSDEEMKEYGEFADAVTEDKPSEIKVYDSKTGKSTPITRMPQAAPEVEAGNDGPEMGD